MKFLIPVLMECLTKQVSVLPKVIAMLGNR
jgi:hypothetical protein